MVSASTELTETCLKFRYKKGLKESGAECGGNSAAGAFRPCKMSLFLRIVVILVGAYL